MTSIMDALANFEAATTLLPLFNKGLCNSLKLNAIGCKSEYAASPYFFVVSRHIARHSDAFTPWMSGVRVPHRPLRTVACTRMWPFFFAWWIISV
jgi:hypothetical protein